MEKLIYPIDEKTFHQNVRIYFENINEGFENFKHYILEIKNEDEMISFMENIYNINGFDHFYIDLYLNRINNDKECEEKFISLLTDDDKETYKIIKSQYDNETIFYKIDKSLVPFITRLSTREILFCTIYATKEECTIWGNYNMRFPVFYIDKSED